MFKPLSPKTTHLMSEKEVLKRLGIPDFRHLSKDTIVKFISAIPQMDPEVAKKALDQFPQLAEMSLGLARDCRETLLKAFDANSESSKASLAAIDAVIEILSEELKEGELDTEAKAHVMDCLVQLASLARDIHKDNQNFILKGLVIFAGVVVSIAGIAVTALGANGTIDLPDFDSDNDFDEDD